MPDANATGQAKVGKSQGATELWVDAGGTLNLTSGKVLFPANLGKSVYPLELMAGRVLASGENFVGFNIAATGADIGTSGGGMITGGSIPKLQTLSTASKVHIVTWASGQAQVLRLPAFVKPPDFDSSGTVTVNILTRAQQVGTNLGWQIDVWDNVNATNIGTSTPALGSSAWTQQTITLAPSANLTGYPGTLAVSIAPKTHANDAMDVYAAWLEYSRRSS